MEFNLEIYFHIIKSAVPKIMKRLEDSDNCRAETKYKIELREAAIIILQRITTRNEKKSLFTILGKIWVNHNYKLFFKTFRRYIYKKWIMAPSSSTEIIFIGTYCAYVKHDSIKDLI